ncbi:glycosyltransferase family 4 protein [bacterium]|nr:glycosyltransferase family 4 protein [bacterium]
MKLAIITDSFPPLKNSGAIQIRDLSIEFVRQGHEVVVITPSSEISTRYLLEEVDRVQVVRLKAPKIRDISYFRRAIAEYFMPFIMIRHLKRNSLIDNNLDGIITYAPSIFLGPLANMLKKKNNCKNYLILRDIFPQWVVDVGLLSNYGLPYYFLKRVERYLYSTADIIGVQTQANLKYFNENVVYRTGRIEVLQNWLAVNKSKTCHIIIGKTKLKGRKIFVYAGNMGVAQGLSVFIDLADSLSTQKSIGFLFVGRGNAVVSLREAVKVRGLDNILIYDEIEPQEIHALYQQCDVGIISLDKRHKTHNIPGKFLSYMQSGLPVLAAINSGNDLEHIINSNKVGCVSTNHSVDVLKKLVEEIVENVLSDDGTKNRCVQLYNDMFSPKKAIEQIKNGLV